MEKILLKELVDYIASFLVEKTGNTVFETLTKKVKLKKVLKDDQKNIKRSFYHINDKNLYNLIECYLMNHSFKDSKLYSVCELSEEQEEYLYKEFINYIYDNEKCVNLEVELEYVNYEKNLPSLDKEKLYLKNKERLIRCIMLHNEAVNRVIMDEKSMLYMNWQQNQNDSIKSLLKQMVNTLSTETELQEKDIELEYTVSQLESILKSFRFDINRLRNEQMVCIYGGLLVLILMTMFMPLYIKGTLSIYISISYIIIIILIAIFGNYNFVRLRTYENVMKELILSVWRINFSLYENQITCKYKIKNETDDNIRFKRKTLQ